MLITIPHAHISMQVPTLLTGRNELCASMITELESLYPPPSDLLTLNFNVPLVDVNLSTRTCTFADRMGGVRHVPYDLLVGADGVGSVVRSSMQAQLPSFSSEEVILPGEYKVALQDMPPLLEQNAIHAMSGGKSGYTLFTIPAKGGKACTLYSWPTGIWGMRASRFSYRRRYLLRA
jgi:2-polyprenyl-6-methoxyphenol hydroxylase-like FAD-dependent oxidoreductase